MIKLIMNLNLLNFNHLESYQDSHLDLLELLIRIMKTFIHLNILV